MFTYFIYIIIAIILLFVLYLAVQAITRGVEAKSEINSDKKRESLPKENDESISSQLRELKNLLEDGTITEEEFNKAKNKILRS